MARKKKPEEHENHERWLVSYADFITLLFAFFVVLYAISQVDLKKLSQAAKSFGTSFNGPSDEPGESGGDTGRRVDADAWRYAPIFPNVVQGGDPPESRVLREVKDRLQGLLASEKMDAGVKIALEGRGLVVRLEPSVAFREGEVKLSPGGTRLLGRLGTVVRALGSSVLVTGHAAPVTGRDVSPAFERAAERAASVVKFLEREQRFPAEKLFVYADGQAPGKQKTGMRPDGELELVVLRGAESDR